MNPSKAACSGDFFIQNLFRVYYLYHAPKETNDERYDANEEGYAEKAGFC
jgi:hypothetical protein